MTIDDFIAMTRRIIAKDGFEEYLPTLMLPQRRHVTVLEGLPLGSRHLRTPHPVAENSVWTFV
jgi:hypothetical protein